MSPRSILITGCNRGIGLELVRQWLKVENPPQHIIATCRKPEDAAELNQIASGSSSVTIIPLEVKNYDQFPALAERVEGIVGKENGLNLLINNAGILPKDVPLTDLDAASMIEGFEVNCVAPVLLTKALLPLLLTAAAKSPGDHLSIDRAAVIQMSTNMASIQDNTSGRYYAYRCGKTALNQATRSMAMDYKNSGILFVSMHPGWVRTDMGGANGMIDTEECCSTMVKTLGQLGRQDHGEFRRYNNTTLTW